MYLCLEIKKRRKKTNEKKLNRSINKSVREVEHFHSTKKRQHSCHILKSYFSSFDIHQSMKTSDSGLKVNPNIYPDAVSCDRMRRSGQIGPINHCLLEESQ